MTVLALDGIRKQFGGFTALDGISLSVDSGELAGIVGPNGAGKTTLFDCITGILQQDSGTVTFRDTQVDDYSPDELAKEGLVRTFQQSRELETLTVRDNVALAAASNPGERLVPASLLPGSVRRHEEDVLERTDELLEFFDLGHLRDAYASELSGGQRKLLGIARALMLEPDVLMLDEPLAGVNPALVNRITDHIQELNRDGMTIVMIEHELETLSELVDRIIVLDRGRVIADGGPDTVLQKEEVIDAYFGGNRDS